MKRFFVTDAKINGHIRGIVDRELGIMAGWSTSPLSDLIEFCKELNLNPDENPWSWDDRPISDWIPVYWEEE